MTIVKSQIRRGPIADMPVLSPGELGFATDENRLFIGTDAIQGTLNTSASDSTVAVLQFSELYNGNVKEIDLEADNAHVYEFSANGTTVNMGTVQINDTVVTLEHGLGRDPETYDVFRLHRNKEVTVINEENNPETIMSVEFEKQQAFGTAEEVGIDFSAAVKNFIKIDYSVNTATMQRQGTLDITIHWNDPTPTYTISDSFSASVDTDLAFSIEHVADNTFKLMYDTTETARHDFKYNQLSYARS